MISYNHKHWFVEKIVLQFVVVVIWTNETEISHIHRNPLVKSSAGDHKVALVPQFILNNSSFYCFLTRSVRLKIIFSIQMSIY